VTVPAPLWTPGAERIERATVTGFARWVQERRGVAVTGSYDDLWRWSVDDLDGFWAAIWEFFDVGGDGGPPRGPVLGSRAMPGAEWFPQATVNWAEHAFRGRDPRALAIQHAGESRPLGRMTWGELQETVARVANGLRGLGVSPGDRVVAYMPNVVETVVAFLACASIGATWASCSPDFGPRAVVDRFAQIEPKVLLAVDGYRYGGTDFDRRETVAGLRAALPTVEHVVVLPLLGIGPLPGALGWEELSADHAPLTFEPLSFDHPLWVLYSSGTTGLPKAIVHGVGGILLEQLKLHLIHLDEQAGDRVFWFTTTGWMMWNSLVGALLGDASIVLYDGNPATPTRDRLWDLAEQTGMTAFGTSPAFIAGCRKHGIEPRCGRDLSALRTVGSTGAPLPPESFEWVYEQVAAHDDLWLYSITGGTDVCTAFLGGVPTLPVVAGELQARLLGVDAESWDPDGRPLTGAVGELVVTQPMPSMPLRFWGDDDGSRLRDAYFDTYPGLWRHGDWVELTERGSAVVSGRSDATINRGGVRMGTSELYSAVLADERVLDALVVDVPRAGTEGWMPLFVVLRDGVTLDDGLITALRERVRRDCSPRHVPDEVVQVAAVPRTLSGKLLELPVKRILMGRPVDRVASRDSLADPAALSAFVGYARRLVATSTTAT
jgi:acetoacetyl-CoA synthetase